MPNKEIITEIHSCLYPLQEKRGHISLLQNKRLLEQYTANLAALAALKRAGYRGRQNEIRRFKSGRPKFPTGYYGSLSHADKLAIAVVSRSYLVGCDIVALDRFKDNYKKLAERFDVRDKATSLKIAKIFSAKEAAIKLFSFFGKKPLLSEIEVKLNRSSQKAGEAFLHNLQKKIKLFFRVYQKHLICIAYYKKEARR
jgi:4'-phosphopantetheinyl transferase EntD